MCTICKVYIYISILYTYVSIQYICSFLIQYNVRDLSIIFGMVHSDRTVVDLLHKLSVSDGLHLILSKYLALLLTL